MTGEACDAMNANVNIDVDERGICRAKVQKESKKECLLEL